MLAMMLMSVSAASTKDSSPGSTEGADRHGLTAIWSIKQNLKASQSLLYYNIDSRVVWCIQAIEVLCIQAFWGCDDAYKHSEGGMVHAVWQKHAHTSNLRVIWYLKQAFWHKYGAYKHSDVSTQNDNQYVSGGQGPNHNSVKHCNTIINCL